MNRKLGEVKIGENFSMEIEGVDVYCSMEDRLGGKVITSAARNWPQDLVVTMAPNYDKLAKGVRCCSSVILSCDDCPYFNDTKTGDGCSDVLKRDLLNAVVYYKTKSENGGMSNG